MTKYFYHAWTSEEEKTLDKIMSEGQRLGAAAKH